MEDFIKQTKERGLKPITYAIFGYMDDMGYITEWNGVLNEVLTPDDFNCFLFKLDEKQVNGLKYRNKDVLKVFEELKYFFEVKIQDDPKEYKTKLFVLKDEGKVFLVNYKNFDLLEKINNLN